MLKKIISSPLLIILLIATVIVYLWFRQGYILGVAEGALPFYDIEKYYNQTAYSWSEHPGLGSQTGIITSGAPTYYLLSLFQKWGVSGYIIQAITFWIILLVGMMSTYFLGKLSFPKTKDKYLLLGALFYVFNPISIATVWNRFLLNFIFFFALFPLALYLFLKGIVQRDYKYAAFTALATVVFSYALSNFVFVILLLVELIFAAVFFCFMEKKKVMFILSYFSLTSILFVCINLWWLTQLYISVFSGTIKISIVSFFSEQTNLATLTGLSKKMGNMVDITRGVNYYLFYQVPLDWLGFYRTLIVEFLEFAIVGLILFVIVKRIKDKFVLFYAAIFFLSLFLIKGNNPPFGELFEIVFRWFIFLQVFRNPFEKFSFLLLICLPILWGFTVSEVSGYFNKKNEKTFYIVSLIITIFLFGWPFFNQAVLTHPEKPANDIDMGFKVKVPEYYKRSDDWLVSQGDNFRIIGLPIADEGITYNWEKGYQGVDLPSTLFTNSAITFNTTVPFYTDIVTQIESHIDRPEDLNKLLNLLNAKYIYVRDDVDYKTRKITDPATIDEKLKQKEKMGVLQKEMDFGKLTFWRNKNWKDNTFDIPKQITIGKGSNLEEILKLDDEEALISDTDTLKYTAVEEVPKVAYKKINSSEYDIDVNNFSKPYILIFSELYNPNWGLFVDGMEIKNHFRANLYANGWLIDKKNSHLKIYFKPQKYLNLGKNISTISFAVLMTFLLFNLKKMISNRKPV